MVDQLLTYVKDARYRAHFRCSQLSLPYDFNIDDTMIVKMKKQRAGFAKKVGGLLRI